MSQTDHVTAPAAPAAAPPPARRVGLLAHLGAVAQLAAMGIAGTAVFSVLLLLLSLGLGLLPALGIGALFLVGFLYAAWATAWLEYARVDGLYRYGLPALHPRTSGRPGFTGWLRTLWVQFVDGSMWRGIASAGISTILGLIVLPVVGALSSSVMLLFAPLLGGRAVRIPTTDLQIGEEWALLVGIIGIIVSLALLVGAAVLHAVLTRAVLVPSREAALIEQARAAGTQRESAVRSGELERTRIERDLHDGVQPRLVSVGMTLGLAQQKIDTDPAAAQGLVD